jgi:hypothetical protein
MYPNAILHEIRQLYNVSDRLDSLAEQYPPRLRRTHHHLGKRSQHSHPIGGAGCNENGADPRIRSSECLIFSKLSWELGFEGSSPKLVVENNIQE